MSVIGHNMPPKTEPVRCFHRYSQEERLVLAQHSSRSNGNEKKLAAGGEFFWVHPDIPDVAFKSRKAALKAAAQRG